MTNCIDHFVNVNGIRMHYIEWPGGEPTVLVVHGLSANARSAGAIIDSLAGRYRVIAPDMRGRGESDKKGPYGVKTHVRDLEDLLNILKIDKVIYIGESMGANLGLQFSVTCPNRVSRLVLGDAGGLTSDRSEKEKLLQSLQASLARLGAVYPSREAYIDFWKSNPVFKNIWTKYFQDFLEADIEVLADGTARTKASKEACDYDVNDMTNNFDYESLYPEVTCPTLLLRAPKGIFKETDYVLPPDVAQKIVSSIPNCRLYEAEGTNHYTIFFVEQPNMIKEIFRFIEE